MNVDLSTTYLGLRLESPLVAAASPLTGRVETLELLQDAGISAAVLPSLFEEQIEHDELAVHRLHEHGSDSFAEALDYRPVLDGYNTGPDDYLDKIRRAKLRLRIPVIASLNGSSVGGWVHHARLIQEAGADALELNVYFVPTDPEVTGEQVERRYLELVEAVRKAVSIPLAVKVGPGFSAPANMGRRLVEAGADGLVLFNRFLRPDIDLATLELVPSLVLSGSYDSRLPLQWIGILRGRVAASLAASSGVHDALDAAKLLLVGADVIMLASTLLKHGPARSAQILDQLRSWMVEQEYDSIEQLKGSMSHANCPDPGGYERANYMKTLVSYSGPFI